MLTSMVGRNSPRPQLPSGAPPANMAGGGDVHSMIRQAMQMRGAPPAGMQPPQGVQMPQGGMQPPQGMQMPQGGMQPPQGMPMPQGAPPAGMPQGVNPRAAMMAQALRRG